MRSLCNIAGCSVGERTKSLKNKQNQQLQYMLVIIEYWDQFGTLQNLQTEQIKQKYITAKNVKNKYKNPTQRKQSQYKKAKRRFEIVQQMTSNPRRPRTRSPMNSGVQ